MSKADRYQLRWASVLDKVERRDSRNAESSSGVRPDEVGMLEVRVHHVRVETLDHGRGLAERPRIPPRAEMEAQDGNTQLLKLRDAGAIACGHQADHGEIETDGRSDGCQVDKETFGATWLERMDDVSDADCSQDDGRPGLIRGAVAPLGGCNIVLLQYLAQTATLVRP
jgi:hypothetical protein